MENRNFSWKVGPAHWPTLMLIIGYPLYWLELCLGTAKDGFTSPLSWWLWIIACVVFCIRNRSWNGFVDIGRKIFDGLCPFGKGIVWFYLGFIVVLLCWIGYVSTYPLHLPQEFDALNYHYTIPRQHLIQGTFAHLPWSHADLFLLPVQTALSPFWFSTYLLNKIPQFIFSVGLILITGKLAYRISKRKKIVALTVMTAVGATHAISIQMGTGMLDLLIAYLFFVAIDSFIEKRWLMFSVQSVFFLFAKPLISIQMLIIILGIAVIVAVGRFCRAQLLIMSDQYDWKELYCAWKSVWKIWGLVFCFVALPFMVKSIWYAGTPTYPLGAGVIRINPDIDSSSAHFQSIVQTARVHLVAGRGYGHGMSFWDFVKHFWLISVPEKGVNNKFDYPIGLVYLLYIGPFLLMLFRSFHQRKLDVAALFIIAYWATWWFGSQQSRFLIIPLIVMYLLISTEDIVRKRLFVAGIILSAGLTLISTVRAHKHLLGKSPQQVMRQSDRSLMELSEKSSQKGVLILKRIDVAYAYRPVWVLKSDGIYTLDANFLFGQSKKQ